VLGVAGLVVGAVAAMSTPATAADGDLVTTRAFSCTTVVNGNPNNFTWSNAQITLSASHQVGSNQVTVNAQVSDMPGIAPVKMMGFPGTDKLVLGIDGTPLTLNGSGSITNSGASQPVPMPALSGTLTSSAATFAVTVTSVQLIVSGITTDCISPAPDGNLGTLTNRETTAPPVTPTPTTTTSATATPTASASASTSASASASPTSASAKGTPAKGTVTFACKLNIGSTFDWKPTVTVSGYRESEGDPVSLVATMTDLPGIAPVPIAGAMDFTLDVKVGSTKTTLKSTGQIDAKPNEAVPVTDLSGEVDEDGDELDVSVSGFTFDFPSGGVGAECTASKSALSAMKVGSEPVESDSGSASGSGSGSSSGSGSLPKTGGGDALPVIALWAIALSLLGAALLLIVPGAVRKKA